MSHNLPPRRTSAHIPEDFATLPSSAAEARRVGSMYYFSGKPCTHGHVAVRRTHNHTCQQCSNEQSYAKWLAKRPEREAAAAQRDAELEARRNDPAYQEARKTRARESKQWRKRQRIQEEGTEEYYAADAKRQRDRYWADPDGHRKKVQDRRDRGLVGTKMKRQRTPPYLTHDAREAMKKMYDTTPVGYVVDHIVPVVPPIDVPIVGIHTPQNLQHLARRENIQKGNQFTCTDAEAVEYVRRGMAVWRCDVDVDTGVVNWPIYPRDEDW